MARLRRNNLVRTHIICSKSRRSSYFCRFTLVTENAGAVLVDHTYGKLALMPTKRDRSAINAVSVLLLSPVRPLVS